MTTYKIVKNGKLPAKLVEMDKQCVYLIGSLKSLRKRKETLILKGIKMIDPINGWFEIIHYSNNK